MPKALVRGSAWDGRQCGRGPPPGLPGTGDCPPPKLGPLGSPPRCPAIVCSCLKAQCHLLREARHALPSWPMLFSLKLLRASLHCLAQVPYPLFLFLESNAFFFSLSLPSYVSGLSSNVTLLRDRPTRLSCGLVPLFTPETTGLVVRKRDFCGRHGELLKAERPAL